MNINEMLKKAESLSTPVVQVLTKHDDHRTILLAFGAGAHLREHITNVAARLFVLKGEIDYRDIRETKHLGEYESIFIEPGRPHEVIAKTLSLCMLIKDPVFIDDDHV